MSDTVIQVEHLSKQYRLGVVSTGTLAHDLNRWWCRVRGKEDPYLKITHTNVRDKKAETGARKADRNEYVWALQNINFEVQRGEVLGIIGRNGAGKSTLLKILSRITAPTEGEVRIRGRISSLLEVGTGFHPELTGRENVYLNGAIHGMTRAETRAKLDEIVEFSGCARYIDTPVKRYSSGMMVRLGFAVAAHLEPEILIVDEVLAVGDAEFQKKCVGKMQDVAGHGRTVLFVSHNMGAVADLCSRALIVREGSIADEGETDQMIKRYLSAHADAGTVDLTHWSGARLGDGPLRFTFARTLNSQGQVCSQFSAGEPLRIVMGLVVPESMRNKPCILAVSIANAQGQRIFHLVSTDTNGLETLNDSPSTVEIEIPSLILNDGQYYITLWAGDGHRFRQDKLDDCLAFRVDSSAQGRSFCLGLVRQVARWRQCDSVVNT